MEDFRRVEPRDKKLWLPRQVEREEPLDGEEEAPTDRTTWVNWRDGEVEREEDLEAEVRKHGRIREPEVGAWEDWPPPPPGSAAFGMGYSDTYWTHFDWRADVRRLVARIQKQFPLQTYANTYFSHPPVYGRTYEFRSVDFWGGGLANGRYAGYRGKSLSYTIDGWKIVNAAMNDAYLPNIYWIIFGGRMWTRGYGWGPSPAGPPDSDPGHFHHVHISYV